MLELAARKNVIPLPSIEAHTGLRLPMDKNTLLGANYRITSQRKPPTTTKVVDQYVRVTNEQADSVCNNLTPQKRRASNK